MKKKFIAKTGLCIAFLFLFMFSAGFLSAANVLVTLRVNMSEAYPTKNVYVGSDWAGWELSKFQKLTDSNNDSIFEITVYLQAGASYNYRYTIGNTDWGGFESLGGTPCGAGPSLEDRNLIVPQTNTSLGVVCFNSCLDCGVTSNTSLNLSVDMTGVGVSSDGLHVAGNFNNWNAGSLELTDANADNIYEISIPVIPNLDYEYNFLNGNSLADAEVVFGTCEFRSKRRVSVFEEDMTVPVVKYGSCNATGDPIPEIKIACIGNSITEGGAGNYMNSWPIQLRNMLGEEYYTENLGVAGTTMSKSGDSPWWNKPQYDYTFALNPDIVVIKLGTNDSKGGNWKPANFEADYIELINQFRAMPSHPVIYMATPAKAYSSVYNINDQVIFREIIPIMQQIAFENAVHLIDLYNTTSYMPLNFPDGIHPNSEGARVIAQKANDNILKAKPVISQIEATTDTTENTLYQWFYNDSPIPDAHHRSIIVTQEGKYRVVVRMSNYSNDIFVSESFNMVLPQGILNVGLTVDYDVVYGVNQTMDSDILIYPNPASTSIKIENAAKADVTIYNDLGNIVMTKKKIDSDQVINIQGLRNGVFFIRISKDNTSLTQRLVVLKN